MKYRVPVPDETAARVLWASDRVCCVCQKRGHPVQIHHIDEDPSNNREDNLAVLCLNCHYHTQITGGFGRKLDAEQVRLYREEWTARVARRRGGASPPPDASPGPDASRSARPAGVGGAVSEMHADDEGIRVSLEESGHQELASLIRDLPRRRLETYRAAQPKWDEGTTAAMHEGSGLLVESVQQMLVELARFYPDGHFGETGPEAYFEQRARDLTDWHWRLLLGDDDPPGTMWGVVIGGEVRSELERLVVQMVSAFTWGRSGFNFLAWRDDWERAV